MDSAEDTVTSSLQRPTTLRKLGDDLDMNSVAAAETALRMGKALPGGTDNVLVVPHGDILGDFHNDDAWVAGFVHLLPEGCGGPENPSRQRHVSFEMWARIVLNRRCASWRKDRYFIFCVAAIIFRHEALSNVQFKLRGRMSESTAEALSRITKDAVMAFAAELQQGKRTSAALNAHPGMRTLLRTIQAVSHSSTWTDHGKHATRMQATSMMFVYGQPFFWLTIIPSEVNSPLVMHYGGHNIDLASTCHTQMPDYLTRLRTVAADPVASATFSTTLYRPYLTTF